MVFHSLTGHGSNHSGPLTQEALSAVHDLMTQAENCWSKMQILARYLSHTLSLEWIYAS
jgi:hypothetical protein